MHYSFECKNINDIIDIEAYNKKLHKINRFSVFYSYQYINNQSSNSKLVYFLLERDQAPIAIMPICLDKIKSNLFELNYYDAKSPYGYNGPLFKSNISKEEVVRFWKEVDLWYSNNHVVTEFIRFNLDNNHLNYSGHLIESLKNIKGELTDFKSIWSDFKQKVRNNYRKALKNNLRVEFYLKNIEDKHIENFYNIYTSTMKRIGASKNYFYPKSYFTELIKHNIESIVLAFVCLDDKPISAELIIIDHETLYSYLGGTLSDYFFCRPNDFLKIETMKWGINNNVKYYVLGGGRKDGDSLYNYKKTFFPKDEDVVFYTGRKIINKEVYNSLLRDIDINFTEMNYQVDNSNNYFPGYRNKKE